MKILVTGTDGYIGAVLAPLLQAAGHEVTGLDAGFYRGGWLFDDLCDRPRTLTRDIRSVTADDLRGFDAVVHLAELSNDPLGAHNPEITYDINFRGSMTVARAAKAAGVPRFVYASSCSVYGAGNDDIKTEDSAPNPQTAYAECKVRCEQGLAELAGDGFITTALRNATAFGASPRMRFDIVLNNLSGLAWTTGRIAMTSDGRPWRPLVHVRDICRAILCTLAAPAEAVRGQIFNVGDDAQNYRVSEIAEIVAAAFPGCEISFGPPGPDNRSYRVSFAKIHRHLPDFRCDWSAERGARELYGIFRRIGMSRETFEAPAFTRINALKQLVASGQLDPVFQWRGLDETPAAEPRMQAAE
ncbi:NAD-dependent epimerase/dehydratase family protein [Oleisolibacter albus]|uniref:NAD-dependent epimerase/dehydratase family protein n=1 Tax=Oleisolibacter albus TaxID=2171757 RepID=UPI000DF2E40B|nr:SDR family oxidoreductase [Oleisolibacter albus]